MPESEAYPEPKFGEGVFCKKYYDPDDVPRGGYDTLTAEAYNETTGQEATIMKVKIEVKESETFRLRAQQKKRNRSPTRVALVAKGLDSLRFHINPSRASAPNRLLR